MSKRRISQQQSARIEKKQDNYREKAELKNMDHAEDGLVITCFGQNALVESITGTRTKCSIRPHIEKLVAGDRVMWLPEGMNQGVVISCYPRQSILGRPNKHGVLKPVAANITQVMVVVAPKPDISWPLLDSYLVMAEYLNLRVCIVLNKIDLDTENIQEKLLTHYEKLGYPLLLTTLGNKKYYKLLQDALNHQTSVFVGQSGVGKSSLISSMLPAEIAIQTAPISTRTELGCHTTSNSHLYHLPSGGVLIDSPGVREFGLSHIAVSSIAKGYREFIPYLSLCKFRNCNHRDTPSCALLKAVNNNLVSRNRYENYVKLCMQFAKG